MQGTQSLIFIVAGAMMLLLLLLLSVLSFYIARYFKITSLSYGKMLIINSTSFTAYVISALILGLVNPVIGFIGGLVISYFIFSLFCRDYFQLEWKSILRFFLINLFMISLLSSILSFNLWDISTVSNQLIN